MNSFVADLAPQLDFAGLNWCGSILALQRELGGTSRMPTMRPEMLLRLSRSMMRHTMTQTRNGQPLLQMTDRSDRVIKIEFLPSEKAAYDAIAKDVQKLWGTLVASNAVAQVSYNPGYILYAVVSS